MWEEKLWTDLASLLPPGDGQRLDKLLDALSKTKKAAIALPTIQHNQEDRESQRQGLPTDRSGQTMRLMATIDVALIHFCGLYPELADLEGVLDVYHSVNILGQPDKEHRNFKIICRPPAALAPAARDEKKLVWTVAEGGAALADAVGEANLNAAGTADLRRILRAFNIEQAGANYLFGSDLDGLAEQREICAFAAGGITHNAARARDDHYGHLLAEADQWLLLARLIDASTGIECRLLIKDRDLRDRLFERAWLICRPL